MYEEENLINETDYKMHNLLYTSKSQRQKLDKFIQKLISFCRYDSMKKFRTSEKLSLKFHNLQKYPTKH